MHFNGAGDAVARNTRGVTMYYLSSSLLTNHLFFAVRHEAELLLAPHLHLGDEHGHRRLLFLAQHRVDHNNIIPLSFRFFLDFSPADTYGVSVALQTIIYK